MYTSPLPRSHLCTSAAEEEEPDGPASNACHAGPFFAAGAGGGVRVLAPRRGIDTRRAGARPHPESQPADDERPGNREGPEEALLTHELVDQLNPARASLPARQREVMIARHFDGKGPSE